MIFRRGMLHREQTEIDDIVDGGKEIEAAVISRGGLLHREQAEIDDIVAEIEAEKSAAKQRTENKQKKEQKATAC